MEYTYSLMDYICPQREYHIGERVNMFDKDTHVGQPIAWEDLANYKKKCVLLYDPDPRLASRPWTVVYLVSVTVNHAFIDGKFTSASLEREELGKQGRYFVELTQKPRYYGTGFIRQGDV